MQHYIEEVLWGIVEHFYISFCLFNSEHQRYERQIERFCKTKQVKRDMLAKYLNMEEAGDLLDHRQFKRLLDNHLEPLQRLTAQFARETEHGQLLQHYVRDIFFETSLLTTEYYKLKMEIPKHIKNGEPEFTLEDLQLFFPLKILYLSQLFQKTKDELESLLVHYRESKILIRSLFLLGEKIIAPAYEKGLEIFLEKIYTDRQVLEFYAKAAFSFYNSGFCDYAIEALNKLDQIDRIAVDDIPKKWQEKVSIIRQHAGN